MLQTRVIPPAEGAYQYPLLIKRLLMSGARYEKTREIIYRDKLRYTYPTLIERVARLANVLTEAGVKAGDTVAVMDWDSHRYLECMFAIPMIGAVIHTINVRLSPEQILYTMNHAEDRFVLVNSEFVGLYQAIAGHLTTVDKTLLLTDGDAKTAELPNLVGEYETLLAAASPKYDFQDFDEHSVATTFYTTGTTGNPKGVYFTHRQLVLHTMGVATIMAARLKEMVEQGLLQTCEVGARSEYQLTDKGRALMPVLVTLAQWGEAHTEPKQVGTRLLDARLLKPLRRVEIVSEDGRVLGLDDIVTQAPTSAQ